MRTHDYTIRLNRVLRAMRRARQMRADAASTFGRIDGKLISRAHELNNRADRIEWLVASMAAEALEVHSEMAVTA